MTKQQAITALMLDFGCVISKTMFENMELVERGLGFAQVRYLGVVRSMPAPTRSGVICWTDA